MIVRVVRMEFAPEKVETFLKHFNTYKSQIRHFQGVHHLELHRDAELANVFYTYSHWENAQALEDYRVSDLFTKVWAETKVLFNGKPVAYSLVQEMIVD